MKMLLLLLFIFSIKVAEAQMPIDSLGLQIDKSIKTFDPVGLALAIVKDGKIIWKKAYGYADQEKQIALTTQHIFNIASCSKAFTATLTAMMVDEEKINWKDKVIDYFPDFKLADPYISRNLNMVDIFSHRSGFATFVGDLLWYHTNYENEEIFTRMQYLPIDYGFREKYGYQNNMVTLGGEIVAKVSGKSWQQNLQERILDPLEMKATRHSNDDLLEDDPLAQPYSKNERIPLYDYTGAKPAAAIFSNVEDLSKWIIFNLQDGVWNGDTLISEKNLHYLREVHLPRPVSKKYKEFGRNFAGVGMGWFLSDYHGNVVVEHSGSMPGYISRVALLPDLNAGFVILNNEEHAYVNNAIYFQILDYMVGSKIADWPSIIKELEDKSIEKSDKEAAERLAKRVKNTKPLLPLEKYTALFRDKWYGDAKVSLKSDKLYLALLPAEKYFSGALEHWHYNTFKVDFKDSFFSYGLVTFSLNSAGEVDGFKIDLPSYDFHFENLDFKKVN